ncbi:adenylate/guanylate cyclase domain-containing protein [Microvirga massiliensis]|uniref:adenylate/guanylate cyclase domain-containing protein n=1 Tax=Microvirga massiliensis TaxID=1033741 RepID=UPI00062BC1B3|nr:adenylate/guanylate cyclase domain-containing protein [Microvirga massiliensis]
MASQEHKVERRLVAIFAADVAGYSRLMEQDEVRTLQTLTAHREIMDGLIAEHGGRIANTAGDSVLAEFPSAVEAVQCAITVQDKLADVNATVPDARRLRFRVGVHVGDVMVRSGDLFGDGINIAARLQALAEPGGVAISGAAHEQVRKTLPLAASDLGPQPVKNMDEPVRAYRISLARPTPTSRDGTAGQPSLTLPEKPSIAVLPFDNMGEDRNDEYLAEGVVEDIIAALSRVRSFFVIARNSTFTYKGHAVNVQQVSRELGVRYVLEGSVRRSRNRVRVTAQLIDATTGAHLWGDRYDGVVEDVFDLQDEITARVAGAIQPSIRAAEVERARRKRPDSLDAYDLVMRSLPFVWSPDQASNKTATELLEKALTLDPGYPLAVSLSAWCDAQRVFYIWSRDVEADKRQTREKAQRAAEMAPDDPFVLTVLGTALTITREFPEAQMMVERALALDPNLAWAWSRSGWLRNYLDDPETAIGHFQRAMRLSPLDPMTFLFYAGIAAAHFIAGRYATSVTWYEKALLANPKATFLNRILAPAYVFAGKQAEAEVSVRTLMAAHPNMTVEAVRAVHVFSREVKDRICEGLRCAGLPE